MNAARTYRKDVSRVRIRGADHVENTTSSIVAKVCFPRRCLAKKYSFSPENIYGPFA
jgi:hypothetical protein